MATDPEQLPAPAVVSGRANHLTRVLAHLHQLSITELGLRDEPVPSLRAEVSRWISSFRGPEASLGLTLGQRLRDSAPDASAPVLQHGDFRLGNALCRGEAVVAVIDWEIWSVGDPRTDLAWLLMRAAPEQLHARLPAAPGMPTREALFALYACVVEYAPPDMEWFSALALYKYAAVVSQMAARRAGTDQRVAVRHAAVPALLADVERLMEGRTP
jgi:aminoglycoside phosphotransferase (APT) family kinase protein